MTSCEEFLDEGGEGLLEGILKGSGGDGLAGDTQGIFDGEAADKGERQGEEDGEQFGAEGGEFRQGGEEQAEDEGSQSDEDAAGFEEEQERVDEDAAGGFGDRVHGGFLCVYVG
jgi:hypothetical protein